METLINFFSNNFANYVWLLTLFIAMIPTLESKIAIPLAINTIIWGSNALSPIIAFIVAFTGSVIPSLFIIILTRKLKAHTYGFLINKKFSRYYISANKINSEQSNFKKYLSLACFVSVPLPLTGVWSGSLIAGLTNLNIGYCFLSISIGSFISCIIITLLCTLVNTSSMTILIASLILIITFLLLEAIHSFVSPIFKKNIKGE